MKTQESLPGPPSNAAPVPNASPIAEPELVVDFDKKPNIFTWVPEVELFPRIANAGPAGYPMLTLQSLSHEAIVDISMSWHVPGERVGKIFLSNPHFSKYHPEIQDGMMSLSDSSGRGIGFQAANDITISIPFISADDPKKEVSFPRQIWGAIEIALIAGQERPIDPRGTSQSTNTLAELSISYRQGRKTYRRAFQIQCLVITVLDSSALGGSSVEIIPRQFQGLDNLRAILRDFAAIPIKEH